MEWTYRSPFRSRSSDTPQSARRLLSYLIIPQAHIHGIIAADDYITSLLFNYRVGASSSRTSPLIARGYQTPLLRNTFFRGEFVLRFVCFCFLFLMPWAEIERFRFESYVEHVWVRIYELKQSAKGWARNDQGLTKFNEAFAYFRDFINGFDWNFDTISVASKSISCVNMKGIRDIAIN